MEIPFPKCDASKSHEVPEGLKPRWKPFGWSKFIYSGIANALLCILQKCSSIESACVCIMLVKGYRVLFCVSCIFPCTYHPYFCDGFICSLGEPVSKPISESKRAQKKHKHKVSASSLFIP